MDNKDHSIGRWISIIYRFGQSHINKNLEQFNISSGQNVILLTLYRNGGISQEVLSDYLKIDKGCIAKSIKKLEDEGYIQRKVDLDDKRAYKVFLTQKALEIIPQIQESIKNWEEIIISDLSDNEKEMMEQILYKMARKACNIKEKNEENEYEKD
ncbi:MAG: MarR family transcriptional regulator [Bacillota bacterium]|nr:MarR family transcriptional regulator [Bacillota bacterium]